ncbi:hypothetical protein [Prochlorococcus marinus]|uniref:hypothetical protein n=1 Tax=Prochlorococcus marinus TaxID=1219 RepID=UPI0007B3B460|nr:hypothetical protein [Prochlorococcus marinus]KZR73798.1 hypothetical protein PMIT1320_02394 [Prochlorococcus marinus str. MIT 1320]
MPLIWLRELTILRKLTNGRWLIKLQARQLIQMPNGMLLLVDPMGSSIRIGEVQVFLQLALSVALIALQLHQWFQ